MPRGHGGQAPLLLPELPRRSSAALRVGPTESLQPDSPAKRASLMPVRGRDSVYDDGATEPGRCAGIEMEGSTRGDGETWRAPARRAFAWHCRSSMGAQP